LERGAFFSWGRGDVLVGDLAFEVGDAFGREPGRGGKLGEPVPVVVGIGVRGEQADAIVAEILDDDLCGKFLGGGPRTRAGTPRTAPRVRGPTATRYS